MRPVNNSNAVVQDNCGVPTNNATSGVRVELTRTRNNFFLGVLGRPTSTVSANATARVVMRNQYEGGNALFIVCGWDTKKSNGSTVDILTGSSFPFGVNTAGAVGQTFVIHNSDGHGLEVSRCDAPASKFKGLANPDTNQGLITMPTIMDSDNGVKAGPTRTMVNGPGGCGAGLDSDEIPAGGCMMLLPIADYHVSDEPSPDFHVVMWLPFWVTQVDANTHHGRLLSDVAVLKHDTTNTSNWTIVDSGIVSVRMVN